MVFPHQSVQVGNQEAKKPEITNLNLQQQSYFNLAVGVQSRVLP